MNKKLEPILYKESVGKCSYSIPKICDGQFEPKEITFEDIERVYLSFLEKIKNFNKRKYVGIAFNSNSLKIDNFNIFKKKYKSQEKK